MYLHDKKLIYSAIRCTTSCLFIYWRGNCCGSLSLAEKFDREDLIPCEIVNFFCNSFLNLQYTLWYTKIMVFIIYGRQIITITIIRQRKKENTNLKRKRKISDIITPEISLLFTVILIQTSLSFLYSTILFTTSFILFLAPFSNDF